MSVIMPKCELCDRPTDKCTCYVSKKFGKVLRMIDHTEPKPLRESPDFLEKLRLSNDCELIKSCTIKRVYPDRCINDIKLCWWQQ